MKKFIVLILLSISFNTITQAKIHVPNMLPISGGNITLSTCPAGTTICPHHDYIEREVTIKSFLMAENEITFEMYDDCVKNGGCKTELSSWAYKNRKVLPPCIEGEACNYPFDEHWGRGSHPVINVGWLDVQKYIKWLNTLSSSTYRLPTSQEWEYAARAKLTTTYSWGDKVRYGSRQTKEIFFH